MDYKRFFGRPADEVARDLLGRILVRAQRHEQRGRILEVGAYEGGKETPSRAGMKYAPGSVFLMPYRGFNMLNIATGSIGEASCIDIRKIIVDERTIVGPGTIANFLNLGESLDGRLLGVQLDVTGGSATSKVRRKDGRGENCIGYYFIE